MSSPENTKAPNTHRPKHDSDRRAAALRENLRRRKQQDVLEAEPTDKR